MTDDPLKCTEEAAGPPVCRSYLFPVSSALHLFVRVTDEDK